ncbi:hypothetical protein POM88_007628 [Heracleum sosnowskyi]|uniref:Uncharacterized protein n=1 Tax=Heracleum sosnowskyi TaxID=360622 RepID=A0AAD8J8G3_9APIA|nr:hypothetical protein POM88_007628 [Heracleum sosnowskyi]
MLLCQLIICLHRSSAYSVLGSWQAGSSFRNTLPLEIGIYISFISMLYSSLICLVYDISYIDKLSSSFSLYLYGMGEYLLYPMFHAIQISMTLNHMSIIIDEGMCGIDFCNTEGKLSSVNITEFR